MNRFSGLPPNAQRGFSASPAGLIAPAGPPISADIRSLKSSRNPLNPAHICSATGTLPIASVPPEMQSTSDIRFDAYALSQHCRAAGAWRWIVRRPGMAPQKPLKFFGVRPIYRGEMRASFSFSMAGKQRRSGVMSLRGASMLPGFFICRCRLLIRRLNNVDE